jgi:hypothetical protein
MRQVLLLGMLRMGTKRKINYNILFLNNEYYNVLNSTKKNLNKLARRGLSEEGLAFIAPTWFSNGTVEGC